MFCVPENYLESMFYKLNAKYAFFMKGILLDGAESQHLSSTFTTYTPETEDSNMPLPGFDSHLELEVINCTLKLQ